MKDLKAKYDFILAVSDSSFDGNSIDLFDITLYTITDERIEELTEALEHHQNYANVAFIFRS